jgi:hypothetical protein
VHDHAGGVDDSAQARGAGRRELCLQLRAEIPGIVTPLYLFTRTRDYLARCFYGERVPALARQLVDGRKVAQSHGQRLLRN